MRRGLLIAVALLAAAWFGLGIRQATEIAAATSIVSTGRHLSPGEAGRARGLVATAAMLNPDSTPDLLRAQLDRDQADLGGARRILSRVVAREPENVAAWSALALSDAGSPATAARAWRNLLWLVPPRRVAG
jgi:hypothetical protein